MVVNGQLHSEDALCPGKQPLLSAGQEELVGPTAGLEYKKMLFLPVIEIKFLSLPSCR
jgi:hypothetical protein